MLGGKQAERFIEKRNRRTPELGEIEDKRFCVVPVRLDLAAQTRSIGAGHVVASAKLRDEEVGHQNSMLPGSTSANPASGRTSISTAAPRNGGDRNREILEFAQVTFAVRETMVRRPARPQTTSRIVLRPRPPTRLAREVRAGVITAASMTSASSARCSDRTFERRSAAGMPMPRSTTASRTDLVF